jgi:hypothetical protein
MIRGVADLHHLDADPDPSFHVDVDPDPTIHLEDRMLRSWGTGSLAVGGQDA